MLSSYFKCIYILYISIRLDIVVKVQLGKTKYADSTKRKKILSFLRDNHSRQENVPMLGQLVNKVYAEPLHNANNAWQQLSQLILQHACAKSAIPKACTGVYI